MYKLFYNLNDRPFNLKPDLKYFYNASTYQQTIMHMHVGFEQPDGVLVLTGEKGIGKTSLITHVLDQLDKNSNIVAVIQQPPQKNHDFLPMILAALKIPTTEQNSKVLLQTLNTFLLEQAKLNKKVRLVIDNAERLSQSFLEFIRLLSTLQLNEHGLFQIILVGTNKLEEILSANENQAFRQQVLMSFSLDPLGITDTREYIKHRLKVAGWNGAPIIEEDAFETIHQLTGGIPSAINRYCDQLLKLGMLRKSQQINKNDAANMTLATIEKLEQFEAEQLEQTKREESPVELINQHLSHAEPEKVIPVQQAAQVQPSEQVHQTVKDIDMENIVFDTPVKKPQSFLNKQTIMTIAGAFLVSALSIFVFDKMSGNNSPSTHLAQSQAQDHSNTHASTNTHENTNSHASANTHENSNTHSSSSEPVYLLNEIPAHSLADVRSGNSTSEVQLLDIQLLLKKSGFSDLKIKSDPSNENLMSVGVNSVSEPSSHDSTKVAFHD